ncbi:unnamed protein product [Closterium sp. NIES-54]
MFNPIACTPTERVGGLAVLLPGHVACATQLRHPLLLALLEAGTPAEAPACSGGRGRQSEGVYHQASARSASACVGAGAADVGVGAGATDVGVGVCGDAFAMTLASSELSTASETSTAASASTASASAASTLAAESTPESTKQLLLPPACSPLQLPHRSPGLPTPCGSSEAASAISTVASASAALSELQETLGDLDSCFSFPRACPQPDPSRPRRVFRVNSRSYTADNLSRVLERRLQRCPASSSSRRFLLLKADSERMGQGPGIKPERMTEIILAQFGEEMGSVVRTPGQGTDEDADFELMKEEVFRIEKSTTVSSEGLAELQGEVQMQRRALRHLQRQLTNRDLRLEEQTAELQRQLAQQHQLLLRLVNSRS